jgi:hypothetical protein
MKHEMLMYHFRFLCPTNMQFDKYQKIKAKNTVCICFFSLIHCIALAFEKSRTETNNNNSNNNNHINNNNEKKRYCSGYTYPEEKTKI